MTPYSCHSTINGTAQRGRTYEYPVQDGWTADGRRRMVPVTTNWLPMACGQLEQVGHVDHGCDGCVRKAA